MTAIYVEGAEKKKMTLWIENVNMPFNTFRGVQPGHVKLQQLSAAAYIGQISSQAKELPVSGDYEFKNLI